MTNLRWWSSLIGCGVLTAALGIGCSSNDGDDESKGQGSSTTGGTTGGGAASNGASSSGAVSNGGGTGSGASASGSGGGTTVPGSASSKDIAQRLGRDHFLIGMGNDLEEDHNNDGAYTLGTTLDLHYAYLVGLQDQGGWTDWNPGGYFVNLLADTAKGKGVVPMFTLYSMAAWGEANAAAATNAEYMSAYWAGAKVLFERLGEFGDPAVVHFEPDWWAFAQQQAADPAGMEVQVTEHAPDCASVPNNMTGMGECLVILARKYSPNTVIGFHASHWAGTPEAIIAYLKGIGADQADIIVLEALDRDAGCFEAGNDPYCTRNDGPWYWDETNQTSPNFHEHLAWAKTIGDGLSLPVLWWQMPFGVPSDTPGGSPGQYRDNKVKYLFEHVDEFVDAGGVGAVFGVGSPNQTYITTDGGQFKNAVTQYFQNPYPL